MSVYLFTPTAKTASDGTRLVAGPCIIVRPLIVGVEVDKEVGPMFRIVQADGQEVSAYADEITEVES